MYLAPIEFEFKNLDENNLMNFKMVSSKYEFRIPKSF